jgi:hypothetical protein
MKEQIISRNLDANETAFFERALTHVKAQTYDRLFPEYDAFNLIPVSTEAGSAATSIAVQSYDQSGMAAIISDYSDDLPRADVVASETVVPVRGIGDSYGYSIQDVRASAMVPNAKLPVRKAEAAKRSILSRINRLAWLGRAAVDNGLNGLVYAPNVPVSQAAATGTGSSTLWSTKTPDNILADLNAIVNGVFTLTNGVERPDTVVLPNAQYAYIASTPRSANSDTSILAYFLANNPFVKSVRPVFELAAVTPRPSAQPGSANIMIAYTMSPDKLTLEIPQNFEQMPIQEKGLGFVVPCHARCAGTVVYYPLSVSIVENI